MAVSHSPFSPSDPALVLFDLDGTLVDSVPSLALSIDKMLLDLGREPAGQLAVRPWVGNGARNLVKRALSNSIQVDENLEEAFVDEAQGMFAHYYGQLLSEGVVLYPGVQEFLDVLWDRNIDMAVVTNKPERFVAPLLSSLAIESYFSILVGGDTCSQAKPHPEPLLHAINSRGVSIDKTLMIGDSKTDINAARNALVPVAAVTYGYNHGESVTDSQPDWVVDSMMELL